MLRRSGFISLGYNKDWNYTFDNDVKFFGGDNGDRFRSAGNRLKLGNFGNDFDLSGAEIGLLMFTGDPGLNERKHPDGTYIESNGNDPDKYRLGAFYIGFKGRRAGFNSEVIRHQVQNLWIHGKKTPHFKKLNNDYKGYFGHYSENPYTTW